MIEEVTVRGTIIETWGTIIETRFNHKHSHLVDVTIVFYIIHLNTDHPTTTLLLLSFYGESNIQVNWATHGSLHKIECFCMVESVNHQAQSAELA